MKINKFFGFLAMAAIAGVALVGCNKDKEVGDDLSPKEAKEVATVKQTISVSFSEDLRQIATIDLSAYDLKGEEVVVMGALYSDDLVDEMSFNIEDLTFPCGSAVEYHLAPKEGFEPVIGKEYNLARTLEVKIELINKKGKVLATKRDSHLRTTAKVVAKENTDWSVVLGGSGSAEVIVEKESDGSIELED